MSFVAFLLFAFAASVTPGPNNIMLTTSGTNFGLRRTLPHIAGILFGFFSLQLFLGAGLASVFQSYPILHVWLRWCGIVYILYIAFRIVNSKPGKAKKGVKSRPLNFFEAFLFQYLNIKGWTMGMSAVALFSNLNWFYLWNALYISSVFAIVAAPCLFFWTSFGVFLRRYLQSPGTLTIFNWFMAFLLILSIGLLFL